MVMSGSSMATYFMVSLILLISAFIIAITVSDQQQQQETRTIVIPGSSSSSTFNIFKKEASSDSEQQFEKIIEALMATQDYSNWAEVLTATFLIPSDNPFSSSCQSLSSTISYHIIPQQLSFSVLRTFPIGSRIPTLLPEKSILVTNNSKSNYTIDGIQITYPDLYMNGAVVVHGINSTLNYTVYGCDHKEISKDTGKTRSLLDDNPFSIIMDDDRNETGGVTVSSSSGSMLWVIVLIVAICCILLLVIGCILVRICFKQQGGGGGAVNHEEEMQPLNVVNQGNLNVGNEQVQEHVNVQNLDAGEVQEHGNVQNLDAEEVVNVGHEGVAEAAALVGVGPIIQFPEEGENGNPILNDQFGGAAELQEDENGNLHMVINQMGVVDDDEEEEEEESPVSIEQESGPENSSRSSNE
ncbi:hypothetical protein MKW98_030730 [Papaver atlanticum]|uniref:FAS1 domain-containing protein n=1 Tax=Papaver atlanticum TaxID=357466 RepID=A0AAD4X5N0_9MAGN|nr:hypothetical protein MKW98_030730 [Papaver atlanticum]